MFVSFEKVIIRTISFEILFFYKSKYSYLSTFKIAIIRFLHLNSTTNSFVALTSLMPVMKIIKSKSSFLCVSLHWNVNGKTVFSDFLCINLFCELSSSSLSLSSHSLLLLLSLLSWLYFFEWRLHKRKLLKPVSHRVYGIKIS